MLVVVVTAVVVAVVVVVVVTDVLQHEMLASVLPLVLSLLVILAASQLLFLPLARFFSMCVPCISLFLSVLLHVCPCLSRFLCPMSVSLSVAADVVSVAGSVASGR